VATKGDKPSGRSRSRAVVHNDRLYLLGGFNMHTKKSFADFYEFNFVNIEIMMDRKLTHGNE
jgi:predicted ester cyclase